MPGCPSVPDVRLFVRKFSNGREHTSLSAMHLILSGGVVLGILTMLGRFSF